MNNDTTTHPPLVGGFTDVDGRRIFVHRAGDGSPPVLILPGASAVGLDYLPVLEQVAGSTTTVVYDRAGTGYSDPVNLPRTCADVATELHELLHAQGIEGPYVLVPHSLGGYYAHRFAQLFPREVAGLVWLDAAHCDWDQYFPPDLQLARTEQIGADPDEMSRMRPFLREVATQMMADFPEPLRQQLIDDHTSDAWIRVGAIERGNQTAPAAEVRQGPGLPDVPLIALTVVGTDASQEEMVAARESETERELNEGKTRLDAAIVASVTDGEQRMIDDVGHSEIIFRRPDIVARAIRDVVDRVTG